MIDLNYLGHSFEYTPCPIDQTYDGPYYKCSGCGMIVFTTESRPNELLISGSWLHSNPEDFNNLSCNEVLIKKLLE